jgi:hypothetical protein
VSEREAVARAITFIERCDDRELLMGIVRDVAPRARRMSTEAAQRDGEDNVPGPASLVAAPAPATAAEAQEAARKVSDFPLLQALARAAGQRIEQLDSLAGEEQ